MRDEPYPPEQVPAYGTDAQPAVLARMRPHLRLTQIGNLVALVAVGLSVAAVVTFPTFAPGTSRVGWAVTALVCSVLLLAICSFQHLAWLRAVAVWSGRRPGNLERLSAVSWLLHLVSYGVLLLALYACIAASSDAGWSATSAVLQAFSLTAMIAAQVLAAVQYVRASGPPGTLPAHMRRLVARAEASRRGPAGR